MLTLWGASTMLDTQNQGPQCTACGSPMKLTVIVPSMWGQDLRTFACPHCKRVQQHIIESTVTEACRRRGRLATEGAIDSVIDPAPASGVPNAFLSATGRTRVRRDDSALS